MKASTTIAIIVVAIVVAGVGIYALQSSDNDNNNSSNNGSSKTSTERSFNPANGTYQYETDPWNENGSAYKATLSIKFTNGNIVSYNMSKTYVGGASVVLEPNGIKPIEPVPMDTTPYGMKRTNELIQEANPYLKTYTRYSDMEYGNYHGQKVVTYHFGGNGDNMWVMESGVPCKIQDYYDGKTLIFKIVS